LNFVNLYFLLLSPSYFKNFEEKETELDEIQKKLATKIRKRIQMLQKMIKLSKKDFQDEKNIEKFKLEISKQKLEYQDFI